MKGVLEVKEDWQKVLEGCTHCIHVACPVPKRNVKESVIYPACVEGSKNVLNACIEKGVKRFIYTSAIDTIYGPDMTESSFNELEWSTDHDKDGYVACKIGAELSIWDIYG